MAWNLFKRGSKDLDFPTVDIKTYRQTTNKAFDNLSEPSRSEALEYVPFFRCINLLTNQAAELVMGSLRVVDRKGKLVDTEYSRHILNKVRENPNEYQSGHEFVKDIMSDLLIDGNALIHVNKSNFLESNGRSRVLELVRLEPDTADVIVGDPTKGYSSMVYHARPFGFPGIYTYPLSSVIHAKLISPDGGYQSSTSRSVFSESARSLLRKALYIGRNSDAWVGDFFDEAARNNLAIHIPYDMPKEMKTKQMQAFAKTLVDKRAPLVLFGGASVSQLSPTPQDADAHVLREYCVQEIGRFYGIPAPLIGVQVTQWGSGIEQLARLQYRYSTKHHLGTLLAALSFRLLPANQSFEIDSSQEIRGDTSATSQFATAMKPGPNGDAILSRAEIRNVMGYPEAMKDDWDYKFRKDDNNSSIDKEREMEYNEPQNLNEGGS